MAAAPEVGENTKLTIDLKTIGIIISFVVTVCGMWFGLKDELIRGTIMDTQDDVEEIKETLKKIDERLYEIQRR